MRLNWLSGLVVRGDGRGRELGFPTANIELEAGSDRPADGVYACWVRLGELAAVHKGALHVGPRPTFKGAASTVEVYILDFKDRDLYGERVQFQVVEQLRKIEKFASADDLVAALRRDCEMVAARLS